MTAVRHPGAALHISSRLLGRVAVALGLLLAALALAVPGTASAQAATKAATDVKSTTLGTPGVSFGFVEPLEPLLSIGDPGDEQLTFVTPLATVPADALAKTAWLNLGQPGLDKEFLSLIWNADSDRGAAYIVSYSVNGAAWLSAVGHGAFEIPDGTHGKTIAIRVWMTTSDANATTRFGDITIEWTTWKGKPTKPTGDGSGVSHKPDASTNGGSGVYTYPSAGKAPAQAPAQSAGGSGSSAGTGGSLSGASGGGSGNGSGVAAAAAVTATEAAAPAPASEVPAPPVMSTGEGDPTAVTGVAANQEQQVSGVPYVPSGGVSSAGSGGTPPGGADGGLNVPVLLISSLVVVLGVVLFVPWLFTAASMREITGYNAHRARAGGPFRTGRPLN